MQPPVGYLVNLPSGLSGATGTFYDYLLAFNGLFIRSSNNFIKATIPLSEVPVRGLAPLDQQIQLIHGKIPGWLGELALNIMEAKKDQETYLAITHDKEYQLKFPAQQADSSHVTYTTVPNTVVELHSHPGELGAFFSLQDREDEQGYKIFVVLGHVGDDVPDYEAKLGIYGHFAPMKWEEVFDV